MGSLFALSAAFSYALSNVLIRRGTERGSSSNNGAFLSLVQTAVLSTLVWVFLILFMEMPPITGMGLFWFFLGGIISAYFGRTLQFASIQRLGSVRSASLKNLAPFFSVILGFMLLGETFTLTFFIGMLFIFYSLVMMIRQSISLEKDGIAAEETDDNKGWLSLLVKARRFINIGYLFGVLSALSYAFGFVVRKKGLEEIPDPILGLMLGGFVGIAVFAITGIFNEGRRKAMKETFTVYNPWLFFGGLAMAFGQFFNFVAILTLDVSRTALLVTTQTLFAIVLAMYVFKTTETITKTTITSAILIMIGAIIILFE